MLMAHLGLVLLRELCLMGPQGLRLIMQGRLLMWRILLLVTTPFLCAPSMLMAPLGIVLLQMLYLVSP